VYSKDVDIKTVEEAIEITRSQSKKVSGEAVLTIVIRETHNEQSQLLEEFGLDFRHLLDSLLIQNPKQAPNANAEFHVTDRRQSKQILQATRQPSRQELRPRKSSSTLQTPAPPTLGPAPIGRNRSPAPSLQTSVSSSSTVTSARPAALNLDSPTSSTYSGRPELPPPVPSARSAMFRSRTPVSASTGQPRSQTPTNNYEITPTAPLSPTPRRTAASPHPPVAASAMRQSNSNPANASSAAASYYRDRDRDRPSKSARGSPVPSNRNATASPVPLPPRSVHRPGSSVGRPPPPPSATIPREGMF
jgi:exocyst complex component 8